MSGNGDTLPERMVDRMGIEERARLLVAALDLPVDAPVSASARLKTIAKDERELTNVLDHTRALFDLLTAGPPSAPSTPLLPVSPWRNPALKTMADQWAAICQTLPALQHELVVPLITKAKLRDLEQLARTEAVPLATKHAIRFALSLFNPGFLWECGKFEIVPALRSWSEGDRVAFRAWIDDPWAP